MSINAPDTGPSIKQEFIKTQHETKVDQAKDLVFADQGTSLMQQAQRIKELEGKLEKQAKAMASAIAMFQYHDKSQQENLELLDENQKLKFEL